MTKATPGNANIGDLGKNVALTVIRQIFTAVVQLLIVIAIARIYGPVGSGVYAVSLLLPMMLANFLSLGLSPANIYYIAAKKFALRSILNTTALMSLALSLVGVLAGAAIIVFAGDTWFPKVDVQILWAALFIMPSSLISTLCFSVLLGLQSFRTYNLIVLIQPTLTILGILTLHFLGNEDLAKIFHIMCLGYALVIITSLIIIYPRYKKKDRTTPSSGPYIKSALGYGSKAHLGNILAFINFKLDIFLVSFFLEPAMAGIYVVAVQLAERLWVLSQGVSTVILPRLSQLSDDKMTGQYISALATRLVLWITLLGSLVMAAIGYPAIYYIFGPEFESAFYPLVVLLPGVVLLASGRIMANSVAALGRPDVNMWLSFLVLIINISLNIILIPRYGITGAAIATSLAYTANYLIRFFIVHPYFSNLRRIENIIITRDDVTLIKDIILKRTKPLN